MAEPGYKAILEQALAVLRQAGHFQHVDIDEQGSPDAVQCPAVFVGMPRIVWDAERLVGGLGNTVAPFRMHLQLTFRLCVFSAQGPMDAVKRRADALQTLVADLRAQQTLGGLVQLLTPQSADLPEPAQDMASMALFAQALLVCDAQLAG